MSKKAIIVHGWGGSSKSDFHVWLKKELEKKGFEVLVEDFPNTDEPEINSWVEKLQNISKDCDENTYLIGHSIGCQTILRFLEKENRKFGRVILIAPWMHLDENTIEEEGEEVREIAKPWMEIPIDFDKVKENAKEFICIFSDDDPYVPLSDERLFKKKLNAKTIVLEKRGHFNDSTLPLLLDYIE